MRRDSGCVRGFRRSCGDGLARCELHSTCGVCFRCGRRSRRTGGHRPVGCCCGRSLRLHRCLRLLSSGFDWNRTGRGRGCSGYRDNRILDRRHSRELRRLLFVFRGGIRLVTTCERGEWLRGRRHLLRNGLRERIFRRLHIPARGCILIVLHTQRAVLLRNRISWLACLRSILLDPFISAALITRNRLRAIGGLSLLLQRTRKRCRSIGVNIALSRRFHIRVGFVARQLLSDRVCRRPRREDCLLLDYQSIHGRTPAQEIPAAGQQCPAS